MRLYLHLGGLFAQSRCQPNQRSGALSEADLADGVRAPYWDGRE
jgi:hypothetical protein